MIEHVDHRVTHPAHTTVLPAVSPVRTAALP
jgi:hypothetical protein